MSARRSLKWGLALSLVLHAGMVASPGWHLPEEQEKPLPLNARLLAAPNGKATEPAAAKPKSVPAKRRLPPPERPAAAVAGLAEPPPAEPAASEAPASPGVEGVPTEAASAPAVATGASAPVSDAVVLQAKPLDWPQAGHVRYRNFGFPGGEGIQVWRHDGNSFQVTLAVGALGVEWKLESAGRILGGQLNVDGFRQTYKGRIVQGLVDTPKSTVQFIRDGNTQDRKIEGAAIDLATLPHFLAQAGDQIEAVEFNAIGGTWVERTVVANRGVRKVSLPIGEIEARYFQAESRNGRYKIEIWLSRDWRGAPVRIVVDDRDGLRYDVQAVEVELDGEPLAKAIEPTSTD